MNVTTMIKKRLDELGLEQRDLAVAAQVTESYISQLLNRRRLLPAPERTDIYEKLDAVLELPAGRLASMVAHERREELLRDVGDGILPLYPEARKRILSKCRPTRRRAILAIFEKQAFGELERLVTQTLLDILKQLVRDHLEDEEWLSAAIESSKKDRQTLVAQARQFLATDILHLEQEAFLDLFDLIVASWDFDLAAFEMRVTLNSTVNGPSFRRFRFAEIFHQDRRAEEPGLTEFLRNPRLSGTATEKELQFLRGLRFTTGRPTALYYYRELQSIRDPLHVEGPPADD